MRNLVEHVKALAADTRELLYQTKDRTGEQLASARGRAGETLSRVQAYLEPYERAAAERATAAARASRQHVREHPWSTVAAALAVAFAVAAVIAWQYEADEEPPTDDDFSAEGRARALSA
jgi:ElaB/YqjD/DUF883 family membrane-anchored ribosome-binding protein